MIASGDSLSLYASFSLPIKPWVFFSEANGIDHSRNRQQENNDEDDENKNDEFRPSAESPPW